MRRPHFSVFNIVQCAILLGAILFCIYAMMQAADRPANQMARPQQTSFAEAEDTTPRSSNRIEVPSSPASVVEPNPASSNPSDHGKGSISGTVMFTSGKAVVGLRVAALSAGSKVEAPACDAANPARSRQEIDRYFHELERQTRVIRSDTAGNFSFTGLDERANYTITAGDPDMGVIQQLAACGSEVKFTFESPVFLDGLVERLDGGSMEPFTVTVENQRDNYWYPVQSTKFDDAGGQFRIRAVQGKVRVTAAMANLIQTEDCIVELPAEGGRVELRLSRAASLHGKVTGNDGNTLSGVSVTILVPGEENDKNGGRYSPDEDDAQEEGKSNIKDAKVTAADAREKERSKTRSKDPHDKSRDGLHTPLRKSAKTDSRGEYRIEGIKPGKHTARATLGNLMDSREVVLVAGDNLADFAIDTGCRVRLIARNTKCETVKLDYATFLKPDYRDASATAFPSSDGSLDYLGLPEGKFIIYAQAQGYASIILQVVLGRGLNTFEVALSEPATVKGHVVTRSGRVPKDVKVQIVPRDSRKYSEADMRLGKQLLWLDAKGDYASEALVPGIYELQVVADNEEVLYTQDLTLSTGEQIADIVLEDGCSLTVNIKFDGAKAEADARMVIIKAGDKEGTSQRYTQITNDRAEYMFLKEGDYLVMTISRNASESWIAVTVRQGANSLEITVGKSNCVRITRVAPDSQGAAAGLKDGDLITEYNGKAINTLQELLSAIQAATSKESVVLVIVRDGASMTFTLKGGKIGIGGQDWHR